MGGASHTHIKPARVSFYSVDLATTVRRTFGYEAYCACGWTGRVWKTHREAQIQRSFHRCASERAG
jgi:hypothetical protein